MSKKRNTAKFKVTVYIPCFNAAEYIERCLKAVLKQSYPIEEILVIDDGSVDETSKLALKFPVKLIKHKTNKGLAAVRNTAVKSSNGEFIAAVDADCVVDEKWLENLMNSFISPKVGGVGGRMLERKTKHIIDSWRAVHMKQEWGEKKTSSIRFLFGSNTVFRKKCILNSGGYNEKYATNYEDVDISKKVKRLGYSLVYVPEALVYHTKKDSLSSLFSAYWNWNFMYHQGKGYYRDYQKLSVKIKENIGLANRFMTDDFLHKRLKLMYIDFLLCMYLFFQDFLFIYQKKNSIQDIRNIPFSVLYFSMVDLTFFYHLDSKSSSLRTLLNKRSGFFQNFLVFALLTGNLLKKRLVDSVFIGGTLNILLENILGGRDTSLSLFSKRLLLMLDLHNNWEDFLIKKHPIVNQRLIKAFTLNFDKWLNGLNAEIPGIFNLLLDSQKKLLVNKGVVCNVHS